MEFKAYHYILLVKSYKGTISTVEPMVRDSTRPTDLDNFTCWRVAIYLPQQIWLPQILIFVPKSSCDPRDPYDPYTWHSDPSCDPILAHIDPIQHFCGTNIAFYLNFWHLCHTEHILHSLRHTITTSQPTWTSWNAVFTLQSVHIIQLLHNFYHLLTLLFPLRYQTRQHFTPKLIGRVEHGTTHFTLT